MDFEKDYPEATVIKLEQNYRSTKTILNAANMVKHQIGVALCFNLNFDNLYQDLRFIPLFPEIKTGAVLIWKKNHIYSQTMSHFIKSIKNA